MCNDENIPTENEIREIHAKLWKLSEKTSALTDEERMYICNNGYYNDVIGGYLIQAMHDTGFSDDDIKKALQELLLIFDDMPAEDARKCYRRFLPKMYY